MAAQIEVKGEGGCIVLSVLGYERLASEDHDDANWLSCQAEIRAGPFGGSMNLSLRTFDLTSLEEELARTLSESEGKASFATDEGLLEFKLLLNKTGRGSVSGRLRYIGGPRGTLDFSFETDQTFLRATQKSLRESLAQFPER